MSHTVLIVDDDPNLLNGLTRALRKEPYQLLTATTGEDAMRILDEQPVDVVIADEGLPGISGTRLLRRVREKYGDTVRFMLTGAATVDVAIEAINLAGVSYFFTKPCNTTDLATAIRLALQQKDLLVAARKLLLDLRRKNAVLAAIEKQNPGITRVREDPDGAFVLDEPASDYETILAQIRKEIGEQA